MTSSVTRNREPAATATYMPPAFLHRAERIIWYRKVFNPLLIGDGRYVFGALAFQGTAMNKLDFTSGAAEGAGNF